MKVVVPGFVNALRLHLQQIQSIAYIKTYEKRERKNSKARIKYYSLWENLLM